MLSSAVLIAGRGMARVVLPSPFSTLILVDAAVIGQPAARICAPCFQNQISVQSVLYVLFALAYPCIVGTTVSKKVFVVPTAAYQENLFHQTTEEERRRFSRSPEP